MDFSQVLLRLTEAARNGSRGIERDKCLVKRDDLNELINQFLEADNYRRAKAGGQ